MLRRSKSAVIVALICLSAAICFTQTSKTLSEKEARRTIAQIAGVELKTDAVRIKELSAFGSSAVVVADVEAAFRLVRENDGKWRVAEVRLGDNRWEDIKLLAAAINGEKTARTHAELDAMATALEAFRRERGFYVVADSHASLIDNLAPRYLTSILRIDPWHRPYKYQGTSNSFVLQSAGADGVVGSADDVVKSGTQKTATSDR